MISVSPRALAPGAARRASTSVATSHAPLLLAPVGLHVAERLAASLAHAEVELLDVLVGEELLARPVLHDLPGLHHVAVMGDRQRHRRVLLDEQDAGALLVDVSDDLAD